MPPSQCSPPTARRARPSTSAAWPSTSAATASRSASTAVQPVRGVAAGACRRLRPLQPAERSMALVDVRQVSGRVLAAAAVAVLAVAAAPVAGAAPRPGATPVPAATGAASGARAAPATPRTSTSSTTPSTPRVGAGRPALRLVPAAVDPAAGGRDPADRGGRGLGPARRPPAGGAGRGLPVRDRRPDRRGPRSFPRWREAAAAPARACCRDVRILAAGAARYSDEPPLALALVVWSALPVDGGPSFDAWRRRSCSSARTGRAASPRSIRRRWRRGRRPRASVSPRPADGRRRTAARPRPRRR